MTASRGAIRIFPKKLGGGCVDRQVFLGVHRAGFWLSGLEGGGVDTVLHPADIVRDRKSLGRPLQTLPSPFTQRHSFSVAERKTD